MDPVLLDAAIPDGDVKDKLAAYGITNVTQLAQQYADTRHAFDSSVRKPGEGATAEEMAAFHRKMGAADSADGYAIPGGLVQSQLGQTIDMMRGIAHTKGMPVDTWNAFTQQAVTANEAIVSERAEKLTAVKEEWRNKSKAEFGDKYDSTKALGQRIVNELSADPELKMLFEKTGLADHPKMLGALAKVAAITTPETAPPGLEGTAVKPTLEQGLELQAEILEIMASDEYRKKSHGRHQIAMNNYLAKQKAINALGFEGATDPRLQPLNLVP